MSRSYCIPEVWFYLNPPVRPRSMKAGPISDPREEGPGGGDEEEEADELLTPDLGGEG